MKSACKRRRRISFDCADCGVDTDEIGEFYSVNNPVWQSTGAGDAMLCVACLEARIGRPLHWPDFKFCPLTVQNLVHGSPRLRERMNADYMLRGLLDQLA